MTPLSSLSNFFTRTGAELHLYHLGRTLAPLSLEQLEAFETAQQPWEQPFKGQARLACVFRPTGVEDPLVWFLALPLDEEGRLSPAQRDAFLERLLTTLGQTALSVGRDNLQRVETAQIDNLMQDNPLAFTPDDTLRAMLHARASQDCERPTSQHHELAKQYLGARLPLEDWPSLGLQGIADVLTRRGTLEPSLAEALPARIAVLPATPLRAVSLCLEQAPPAHAQLTGTLGEVQEAALLEALIQRGQDAREQGDLETLCACLRAASASPLLAAAQWIDALLEDDDASSVDVLVAIAARGYAHLEDAERLPVFLTRLASCPHASFGALARDLALIPRLRLPVLMTLRNASPDSALGKALGALMQQASVENTMKRH
ncbi:DUF3549 family protein [Cobetia sp. L2A1]|jgi:hypothetical protein|uniref:DUF3549 family protein n=1 Tax=Cobetia sp. L2A1 TaxID=2686360 RepID=UPI00131C5678|nr:DUF3549 family protein [Cobetia sp. L2A1]